MGNKLFIYDVSDEDNEDQALGRFDVDEVEWVGVSTMKNLLAALDRLVRHRATFDRVLVQTHGHPGHVDFGNDHIWDITLEREFAARNYHTLFPQYTRFYFDGCNVAEGSLGTEFLEAVGPIFLRMGGGVAQGWTSAGYGYSSWVPFIGGHTIHWSGGFKSISFAPGGNKVPDLPSTSIFPPDRPHQKDYIGHNI